MNINFSTDNLTYFDLFLLRQLVEIMEKQARNPEFLNGVEDEAEPAPATATAPAAKKRGRPKADHLKVVEPPPAPAPAPEPAPQPEAGDTISSVEITIEDVRSALQSYSKAHSVAAAYELLKKYSATRISDLQPEHYASFVRDCQ